jgi:hypothetical protein
MCVCAYVYVLHIHPELVLPAFHVGGNDPELVLPVFHVGGQRDAGRIKQRFLRDAPVPEDAH